MAPSRTSAPRVALPTLHDSHLEWVDAGARTDVESVDPVSRRAGYSIGGAITGGLPGTSR